MNLVPENLGSAWIGAVTGSQWGDEGKGKIVDSLAAHADIVFRNNGGANSGHTVHWEGKPIGLHLIPCSIFHDSSGVRSLVCQGVAFDPRVGVEELDLLKANGVSFGNLRLSLRAKLTLPQHLLLDRLKESKGDGKIGTTGRGVGPCYTDHVARIGLTLNDLLNPDVLYRKIKRNLDPKMDTFRAADPEVVKRILNHEHLEFGRYYHPERILNVDEIVARYLEFGRILGDMICDTEQIIQAALGKRKILGEAAQGLLLSVDQGTTPFVTSADCSLAGLIRGLGFDLRDIDFAYVVAKAPYMTRVGLGPFPTEMGGRSSDEWCNNPEVDRKKEREVYAEPDINSSDEFEQGVAIRRVGDEFGTTTQRSRRVGWLDLPLLRYAIRFTGGNLVLTKVDVMDSCARIKICTAYEYVGPDYRVGELTLKKGDILKVALPDPDVLDYCRPIYHEMPGWVSQTKGITSLAFLPTNLVSIVRFIEYEANVSVRATSHGPGRDEVVKWV